MVLLVVVGGGRLHCCHFNGLRDSSLFITAAGLLSDAEAGRF